MKTCRYTCTKARTCLTLQRFTYIINLLLIFKFYILTYIRFTFSACRNKTYGANCSEECGYCLNDAICHHINGSCKTGCEAGWKGDSCIDGISLTCSRI